MIDPSRNWLYSGMPKHKYLPCACTGRKCCANPSWYCVPPSIISVIRYALFAGCTRSPHVSQKLYIIGIFGPGTPCMSQAISCGSPGNSHPKYSVTLIRASSTTALPAIDLLITTSLVYQKLIVCKLKKRPLLRGPRIIQCNTASLSALREALGLGYQLLQYPPFPHTP